MINQIVEDNIILQLSDDSPESKLLGIQIDIDLEDKSKTTEGKTLHPYGKMEHDLHHVVSMQA